MTAALFAVLALAQPEPKVSIDLPISSLHEIIREVSRQTQVEHRITGPEPSHWLFVQVKEMPAARLRDALAKATGGRWMKAGDTWALQTVELQSHQDKAFAKSMAAWKAAEKAVESFDITAYEAAMKKAAELSRPEMNQNYQELAKLQEGSPDRRFLRRVVQSLPLAELTSLGANETRFYSLQPTSLQRQLPNQAAAAFSEFLKESAKVSERADIVAPESGDGYYYNSLAAPYRSGSRLLEAQKFVLVLSRESLSSDLVQAEALIFDKSGRRVHNSFHSITGSKNSTGMPKIEGTKVFEGLDQKLEFPPDEEAFARDIISAFGGLQPGQKRGEVSPATTQRLLNMDKVDPLAFGPTYVMRSFAAAKRKQVVARIHDLAVLSLAFILQAPQGMEGPPLANAAMITTGAFGAENPDILEQEDLIVFPPISSSAMPNLKMPRRETADLLKAASQRRDLLDPLSSLAGISSGYEDLMLPAMLTGLFGSKQPLQPDPTSFDVIKLYGLLPGNQKQMVKQGGLTLSLDGLPPTILKQVRHMLLGRRGGFTQVTPEMREAIQKGQMAMEQLESTASNIYTPAEEYEMIPSVFLAGPKAQGGTVSIHLKIKDVILQGGQGTGMMRETSPQQVAWSIRSQETSPSSQWPIEKYGKGSVANLTATFMFSGSGIRSFIFSLPSLSEGVELKELKDMPAEFQEEVRRHLEDIRKYPIHQGGTGGAIKPPFQ